MVILIDETQWLPNFYLRKCNSIWKRADEVFLLDFNFSPLNFSPCWSWQKFSFDNTFSGNAQKYFRKISLKSENLFWLLFRLSYTFRVVSHSWNTMRYESNIDRLAELVFLFYTATIGNSFSRIFRTLTSIEGKKMLCSSIVSRIMHVVEWHLMSQTTSFSCKSWTSRFACTLYLAEIQMVSDHKPRLMLKMYAPQPRARSDNGYGQTFTNYLCMKLN